MSSLICIQNSQGMQGLVSVKTIFSMHMYDVYYKDNTVGGPSHLGKGNLYTEIGHRSTTHVPREDLTHWPLGDFNELLDK